MSGTVASGVSWSEISADSPGASDATGLAETRLIQEISGSSTWMGPVASPPVLVTLKLTVLLSPRSAEDARLVGSSVITGRSRSTRMPIPVLITTPSVVFAVSWKFPFPENPADAEIVNGTVTSPNAGTVVVPTCGEIDNPAGRLPTEIVRPVRSRAFGFRTTALATTDSPSSSRSAAGGSKPIVRISNVSCSGALVVPGCDAPIV